MKFQDVGQGVYHRHVLELTRHNLETLLMKMDSGEGNIRLIAPGQAIEVRGVENDAHYTHRPPGDVDNGRTGPRADWEINLLGDDS